MAEDEPRRQDVIERIELVRWSIATVWQGKHQRTAGAHFAAKHRSRAVLTLAELTNTGSQAIDGIRCDIAGAACPCSVLPPSGDRENTLVAMQRDTSTTFAQFIETGGILVDSGWLRFLGCGHEDLPRRLDTWNTDRVARAILVADDVIGGFFAINQGAFGAEEDMYYWAPDRLQWEPIGFDFSFFFRWSLTGALADFYQHYRWSSWVEDVTHRLAADHCFAFDPPLWCSEGSVAQGVSDTIPIEDMFALKSAAQQAEG